MDERKLTSNNKMQKACLKGAQIKASFLGNVLVFKQHSYVFDFQIYIFSLDLSNGSNIINTTPHSISRPECQRHRNRSMFTTEIITFLQPTPFPIFPIFLSHFTSEYDFLPALLSKQLQKLTVSHHFHHYHQGLSLWTMLLLSCQPICNPAAETILLKYKSDDVTSLLRPCNGFPSLCD